MQSLQIRGKLKPDTLTSIGQLNKHFLQEIPFLHFPSLFLGSEGGKNGDCSEAKRSFRKRGMLECRARVMAINTLITTWKNPTAKQ